MKYKHTKEELEIVIKKSLSIAQVCRELGINPKGGNYKTLNSKIKEFSIDISHFTGAGWNVGERYRFFGTKSELKDILVENSSYKSSNSLRKRLIKEGLKEHQCECCFNKKWEGKDIPLELNHRNGINTDNRIENLEILCPNCHAQTSNYRGKNKKDAKRYFIYKPVIKKVPDKIIKFCKVCNNTLKKSKLYCSEECRINDSRKNIPTKEELIKTFKVHKSFLQTGKYFKVSDNAVRKWCKKYNILEDIKKLV